MSVKDDRVQRMLDHIRSAVDVDPWALAILEEIVDRYWADGCSGCAFFDVEEWEMPCAKCQRNSKDYWRKKAHNSF